MLHSWKAIILQCAESMEKPLNSAKCRMYFLQNLMGSLVYLAQHLSMLLYQIKFYLKPLVQNKLKIFSQGLINCFFKPDICLYLFFILLLFNSCFLT